MQLQLHVQLQHAPLDPISEWRACQALSTWFTILLNRQLRRRWQLEHKCMQDRPVSQRFRPVIFLEPVPPLHKPLPHDMTASNSTSNPHKNTRIRAERYNPYNSTTMSTLKTKIHLLRGRVEKGKELASEIERRMLEPGISFPTHFCHTCVVGGEVGGEILLTRCGHRVCRTCLYFGIEDGSYECAICFEPASFVGRSALSVKRARSEHVSSVLKEASC